MLSFSSLNLYPLSTLPHKHLPISIYESLIEIVDGVVRGDRMSGPAGSFIITVVFVFCFSPSSSSLLFHILLPLKRQRGLVWTTLPGHPC